MSETHAAPVHEGYSQTGIEVVRLSRGEAQERINRLVAMRDRGHGATNEARSLEALLAEAGWLPVLATNTPCDGGVPPCGSPDAVRGAVPASQVRARRARTERTSGAAEGAGQSRPASGSGAEAPVRASAPYTGPTPTEAPCPVAQGVASTPERSSPASVATSAAGTDPGVSTTTEPLTCHRAEGRAHDADATVAPVPAAVSTSAAGPSSTAAPPPATAAEAHPQEGGAAAAQVSLHALVAALATAQGQRSTVTQEAGRTTIVFEPLPPPPAPAPAPPPPDPIEVLRERWHDLKRGRIRANPPAFSTRASLVGESCERRLYYERTVPAGERRVHEVGLQAIFDLGLELERYVLRELEDMGVEITQRGRDYVDRDLELSGHIDALIRVPGHAKALPAEIKGLNPYTAGTISSARDIAEHPQPWVRKYWWQLQAYLHFTERPLGVFVLLNKSTGRIDFVPAERDEETIRAIRERAVRVRDAVRVGAPLERRPGRDCERCPFLAICGPDRSFGPGVRIVEDPELEALLARRAELEGAHREYERLDKAAKQALPQAEEALVGSFLVRGKQISRKGYSVEPKDFWQFSIERRPTT